MKIIGNRVVAAKLSGSVDFLELESYSHGRQMDWGLTAYRRSELHKARVHTTCLCYMQFTRTASLISKFSDSMD